jgi:uncharacterized membrane protein YqjE
VQLDLRRSFHIVAALLLLLTAVVFLAPIETISVDVNLPADVQGSGTETTNKSQGTDLLQYMLALVINLVPLAAHLALYGLKLTPKAGANISAWGLGINGITLGLLAFIAVIPLVGATEISDDANIHWFLIAFTIVFFVATYAFSFWVFSKSRQHWSRLVKLPAADHFT